MQSFMNIPSLVSKRSKLTKKEIKIAEVLMNKMERSCSDSDSECDYSQDKKSFRKSKSDTLSDRFCRFMTFRSNSNSPVNADKKTTKKASTLDSLTKSFGNCFGCKTVPEDSIEDDWETYFRVSRLVDVDEDDAEQDFESVATPNQKNMERASYSTSATVETKPSFSVKRSLTIQSTGLESDFDSQLLLSAAPSAYTLFCEESVYESEIEFECNVIDKSCREMQFSNEDNEREAKFNRQTTLQVPGMGQTKSASQSSFQFDRPNMRKLSLYSDISNVSDISKGRTLSFNEVEEFNFDRGCNRKLSIYSDVCNRKLSIYSDISVYHAPSCLICDY